MKMGRQCYLRGAHNHLCGDRSEPVLSEVEGTRPSRARLGRTCRRLLHARGRARLHRILCGASLRRTAGGGCPHVVCASQSFRGRGRPRHILSCIDGEAQNRIHLDWLVTAEHGAELPTGQGCEDFARHLAAAGL